MILGLLFVIGIGAAITPTLAENLQSTPPSTIQRRNPDRGDPMQLAKNSNEDIKGNAGLHL